LFPDAPLADASEVGSSEITEVKNNVRQAITKIFTGVSLWFFYRIPGGAALSRLLERYAIITNEVGIIEGQR
jgi:hypothetical protein